MDYVYAVREMNHEVTWVVSLHRTYKGAYVAMKELKLQEFSWWRSMDSNFRRRKWNEGHWWRIVKMEIQP